MVSKIPLRSIHYQWESLLYRDDLSTKKPPEYLFGSSVLSRNKNGQAENVRFSVYFPGGHENIFLIGEFNNWGDCTKEKLNSFLLTPANDGFLHLTTNLCKHKDSYLFLSVNGSHKQILRDPAAKLLNGEGNCIFWDFEDPTTYKKKYSQPNTLHQTTNILQTDVPGLVARWFEYDSSAKTLAESNLDLFTYIRTCGVLEKIKDLGFNTIQFLPLAQSIDGDNWKFRYLVAFPFAIQKNWGDPDSFHALIDHCHKLGLGVIIDLIISHCPFKDYQVCGIKGEDVGVHLWKAKENHELFLDEITPWGTKRFRYGDPMIRNYLTESALFFAEKYDIDGFRIDNVDGILRFGPSGDGEERPHGRLMLRELISSLYEYNPLILIHLESHYFYGDNAKLLVAPLSSDPRALGATAYNSSRLTYFFHTSFMPKTIEEISIWRFEHIREEKEWGKSNSTIADFHNHDAAAGLIEQRATGSYAYDALILKNPDLDFHARGKIRVMESIISFGCEGRLLDLLQTSLLQKGTFEHDSSIHWGLLETNANSKITVLYKQKLNKLLEHAAFWPENTLYRKYVNIDEGNKIIVIKRSDKTQDTKTSFYILINTSSKVHNNYAIGVEDEGKYDLVFNSETINPLAEQSEEEKIFKSTKSTQFEFFSKEIRINTIQPYQVVVLKRSGQ